MKTKELKPEVIDQAVPRSVAGVYRLYHDQRGQPLIRYVGRSDTDLARRLKQHAREGRFERFDVTLTRGLREAYWLESREWHRFSDLINQVHPRAPRRLRYNCPYCWAARLIRNELKGLAA